ncbi:WAT1-related protein [Rhynchospora pubera]|uniref:WAT1-related protein n=1 Tax=Rhynchospora pubera TaxID=906938 RepID=A0AAV8F6G0_9POAL|nr:WAT1-related protein [Rhynchospora pubera]
MAQDKRPYVVVVIIQAIYTGMFVLSKAAFDAGLSPLVFLFYRQALASIALVPITIVLKWGASSNLSFMVLFKIFMLALIGITFGLNVSHIGLKLTSETVGSAAFNAIPVITFFLAFLMRMETLNLTKSHGIAKAAGVILCLAGVGLIAFYMGPSIPPLNHHQLFHPKSDGPTEAPSKGTWIKGTFLLFFSNVAWSLWLVMQGFILKECPSKILLTTIQCVFSTFQTFVVAIVFERDFSKWKMGFDVQLLSVVYCALCNAGISWYLQAWCLQVKGPVFVAMSNPLCIIFTVLCALLILGAPVSLGSILGGILTVAGLYSVLWGKSIESKMFKLSNENSAGQNKEEQIAVPIGERTPQETITVATRF